MRAFATALILTLGLTLAHDTDAGERCPADKMGCNEHNMLEKAKQRLDQAAREVMEADNMRERLEAAKKALEDCAECATKVFTDQADGVNEF